MQIRYLTIKNFRGIASLTWTPSSSFCCVIGPGDSGKSATLDAVEAALSSRWFSFSESDFLGCNTGNCIEIEVTIGELSKPLKSDERFGLYIRGWTPDETLRDEPEDGDEPVLTVKLTVNATLEPVWELVCDRADHPRTLSNRDRALFGLVRLAGDDARHLAWGQGSVLAKLTGDNDEAAQHLAQAYRAARDSAKLHEISSLSTAAESAEGFAKNLGAYVEGAYGPGLELGRSGLSSGAIALHDDGVPLRLAGLGTRRLATLAIQKSAIIDGAIVLVDEIEHGLEPHRIIGAISQLKSTQTALATAGKPIGQVLMTTHSDVALAEVGPDSLFIAQRLRPSRKAFLRKPSLPEHFRPLMRFTPRALFARRILVCEGMTEVGMLLGIREYWAARNNMVPIEQLGSALADGNGNQACAMALALAELGYVTALYRDSDTALSDDQIIELAIADIPVFEYGGGFNSEQAIFSVASNSRVQQLLDFAREERGEGAVNDNLMIKFPEFDKDIIRGDFAIWGLVGTKTEAELREGIAEVAARRNWFKDQRLGRGIAPIVWHIAQESPTSNLATTLKAAEDWIYG
jgi:hypothetical protein